MSAETIARALQGCQVGDYWMALCPTHDDHDPSLSIRNAVDGKVLVHCHAGCEQAQVIGELRAQGLWVEPNLDGTRLNSPQSRPASARTAAENLANRTAAALQIWRASEPASSTPVQTYLQSRGIRLPPPPTLRFHPRLKHPMGDTWPGLVAFVTRGTDDLPLAVHRTFLSRDGTDKAPVEPQKMMLGSCRRGAVRLGIADRSLMVGEGIETCFAAMQATGRPAWAALSTSGLRTLDLPAEVREVIVLADGDAPGTAAARDAARRWHQEGRRVRVARPPAGMDFNDMLLGANEELIRTTISNAEAITDPLSDLIERACADPGTPFAPEVLKRFAALKKANRTEFEGFRARLKQTGCRMAALDKALAEKSGDAGQRQPKQADTLIELARGAELFHTPDMTGYADLQINAHRETWPIRSKGFRRWLTRRFYEVTGGAPNAEALQSALNVIEARAHFDGPEREVHLRVGGDEEQIYLDLADEAWRAVEIGTDGWRVVDAPPVRFRRTAGTQPLPAPNRCGSIETLRTFLNVRSDRDFTLVVAWALAVLRNRGPYPVLVLSGEQGSAKSTFSAILRSLLDPNTAPLRALPREDRDLFIAARNGHVLAFDNVSGLPPWISDTLCRLANGGGFAVRQLYTDQDEVLFDAARPVMLNGIEDIVTRPDLADRAIFLSLEAIPETRRRPEKALWADFEAVRPQLLGTLLDGIVHGLKQLPSTQLNVLPRMADFALWATACETAFWPPGTFAGAYAGNRDEAVEDVIDADPVAAAVRAMMVERGEWTGTASELLGALAEVVGERIAKSRRWPESPRALSGRLRRTATCLRKLGIEMVFGRTGRERTRFIRLRATAPPAAPE